MSYAFLAAVLAVGGLALIVSLARQSGRDEAQKDAAKAETEEVREDAQKWADRPRDLRAASAILRKRADLKRDEANLFH